MDFRAALVATLLAAPALAQVDWEPEGPVGRSQHRLVYDAARGKVLLFGGTLPRTPGGFDLGDTWEWDGSGWTRRRPVHAPPARAYHALAYDAGRARVVLFGGVALSGQRFGDTWEWDGSDWVQRFPAATPPARTQHAMCHDVARGVTVLFGGIDAIGTALAETWEWDGSAWRRATPAAAPPHRRFASLVHDPLRRRSVLFGGMDASGAYPSDVWEFDGVTWRRLAGTSGPAGRIMHAATFDATRGAVVVMDGLAFGAVAFLADAWAFDGTRWTALPRNPGPGATLGGALAFDERRQRAVHFGGVSAGSPVDVWEFDGAGWTRGSDGPPALAETHVAFDTVRDRIVVFGGAGPSRVVDETWEGDGVRWSLRQPPNRPRARVGAAIAYDPLRRRVVLFGGGDGGGALFDDTWEWDGSDWSRVPTSRAPQRRHYARMTHDASRGRIVLFGGTDSAGALADTWEYDGRDWTMRTPVTIPPGRHQHAMVFDPRRGRTLMFGGDQAFLARLDDTWEWDGVDWRLARPTARPTARSLHALAHDPVRDRIVLHAGMGAGTTLLGDVWEWDGADWTPRTTDTAALPRAGFGMGFRDGRITVLGGGGPVGTTNDVWRYGATHPARFDRFGAGCAGTLGVPELRQEPYAAAWLGAVLGIAVGPVRPGSPAILLMGLSDRQWGALPLPLGLDPFGLRGCSLFVAPVADTAAIASPQGTARWRLPICACPALLGARLFVQALVADPAANPAGAVTTDAASIVVGGR